MKLTTKTIVPMLLATTAISGVALASDSYAPQPSWMGYESTVSSSMPISQSFNKLSKETTTTDNSKRASDSFNRSAEFDLDVDASRRMDDSYNTDNSKSASSSFNKSLDVDVDASRKMDDSYNTDNSKHTYDSFNRRMDDSYNTDNSRHAQDSYNTDKSIKDSYNTANNQRQAAIHDAMSVTPTLNSAKTVSSGDVQGASNSGYLSGHTQSGYQGSVDVGGIGNDAPSYGYDSGYGHGSGGADNRNFRNDQEIAVYGPNLGAVSNTSVVNQGRDLVFGPNRSAIGNDFGNKQIFSAGDQAQLQKNDQFKSGDNSASAVDNITTTATKSSRTITK